MSYDIIQMTYEHYTNVQAIAPSQTCNMLSYTYIHTHASRTLREVTHTTLLAICEEDSHTHSSCNLRGRYTHVLCKLPPFFNRTRDCHNIFYFKVHLAKINRTHDLVIAHAIMSK